MWEKYRKLGCGDNVKLAEIMVIYIGLEKLHDKYLKDITIIRLISQNEIELTNVYFSVSLYCLCHFLIFLILFFRKHDFDPFPSCTASTP